VVGSHASCLKGTAVEKTETTKKEVVLAWGGGGGGGGGVGLGGGGGGGGGGGLFWCGGGFLLSVERKKNTCWVGVPVWSMGCVVGVCLSLGFVLEETQPKPLRSLLRNKASLGGNASKSRRKSTTKPLYLSSQGINKRQAGKKGEAKRETKNRIVVKKEGIYEVQLFFITSLGV